MPLRTVHVHWCVHAALSCLFFLAHTVGRLPLFEKKNYEYGPCGHRKPGTKVRGPGIEARRVEVMYPLGLGMGGWSQGGQVSGYGRWFAGIGWGTEGAVHGWGVWGERRRRR